MPSASSHCNKRASTAEQAVFEYFPPTTFDSIMKYTTHGTVSLSSRNPAEILDLLLASGELCLQDLSDRIQTYLIEQNTQWTNTHFVLAYRAAFQDESFSRLQAYCNETFEKRPEVIFNSSDFGLIPKRDLLRLLKQKNPTVPQVQVWESLIEWGLAQTPGLPNDIDSWSSMHWSDLKRTIRDAVPLIRFWRISPNDFLNKVIPFEKALPRTIFHDILRHYLVPQPPPQYTACAAPPPPYPEVDSAIINAHQVGMIANWIAWSKQTPLESKGGFQFKLLLRGSQDGFSPVQFHERCDSKGPTFVVIKVRGTGQIIGGYNPGTWLSEVKLFSTSYHNTNESFIFSFGVPRGYDDEKQSEPVWSRIKDSTKAVGQYAHLGPDFGESDLSMQGFDYHNEKLCFCRQDSYEFPIMGDGQEKVYFAVEEYEVFEVILK
ncbi:4486_t:CDS:2 [Ambispora leptoticha]|uniref:4486_t:CDS:1 n=1 Tax=Ambispora leptoticha TaxID=144679 RepID=A0A9N9AA20_9GLOM|nr:4486_t:CDS:2 [Ambispora leptoticha]